MKLVVLVRHGHSELNTLHLADSAIDGYPLTAAGRRMAVTAAECLKSFTPFGLYTSPVQRARETAEIIGKALRLDYMVDKRLQERHLTEPFKGMRDDGSYDQSGYIERAEDWESVKSRMASFINDLGEGLSVAVTHGDPIRAVVASVLKLGDAESWGAFPDFCTFTALRIDPDLRIVSIGALQPPADLSSLWKP